MNKEFIETLFFETFETAYGNSEQAMIFRSKILEKIEILKDKGIEQINTLDLDIQGLVTDKLISFFIGNVNIFKEIYGLDENNKAEMIVALKNHSELIIDNFRDHNEIYNLSLNKLVNYEDEIKLNLNSEEKKVFNDLENLQTDREFFIIELKFEVMLRISEFLYRIEKIKEIDFMIEKKTPEETEV